MCKDNLSVQQKQFCMAIFLRYNAHLCTRSLSSEMKGQNKQWCRHTICLCAKVLHPCSRQLYATHINPFMHLPPHTQKVLFCAFLCPQTHQWLVLFMHIVFYPNNNLCTFFFFLFSLSTATNTSLFCNSTNTPQYKNTSGGLVIAKNAKKKKKNYGWQKSDTFFNDA